ncbi:MAG: cohesin domain-containing protein [Oscillospiraceae bacterium]|nr:cohesin domain-containing protein [Oscillospiraceae bacterium]
MKKLISLVLAVALLCALTVPVAAATSNAQFSLLADKTSVQAGETVQVEVKLDKDITDLGCFEVYVWYNPNLFEFTSATAGTSYAATVIGNPPLGNYQTESLYKTRGLVPRTVNGINAGNAFSMTAGTVATLTFTAKTDSSTAADAAFVLVNEGVLDTVGADITGVTMGAEQTVAVSPASADSAYTVSMPADQSVVVGGTANVDVTVGATGYETFNAVDLTVAYDSARLELATESLAGYTLTPGDGTVRIQGYGADKALGKAFTLGFTAKATGDAAVTLTSAKVDVSANAIAADAPEAAKTDDSTVITVCGYSVNLSGDFTGADVVVPKADYTFTAKDTHYNYAVTATMNGVAAAVVDNGDGTFTIKNVTGALAIAATKTAKTYAVTPGGTGSGDVTAAATAAYGTDYSFQVTQLPGFGYGVSVTVGGAAYTGFSVSGSTYTIPGTDVTDDIAITVTKTALPVSGYTVQFAGNAAGDAAGADSVQPNESYTFTLSRKTGYDYAVSATMGGSAAEVTDNGNDTYTITGVTGDLVVTLTKTGQRTVSISEYVKLDGKSIFLVKAAGTLETGKIFAYGGSAMFYSEKYSAYCYLTETADALTEQDAAAQVTEIAATAEAVSYAGDVNGSGKLDINDAQLVYDLYNAKYDGFDTVSMAKFLRADLNGSGNLTVEDAAAVVSAIH